MRQNSQSPTALADPSALHVLVVEDHATNRRVAQIMLEALGHQVSFAEDGRQGVDAFRERHFDVILMDLQMPVMDGLSATREIRELEAASAQPRTAIAMLTANVGEEFERAAFDCGADGYISKPVSLGALARGLADALVTTRRRGLPPLAACVA